MARQTIVQASCHELDSRLSEAVGSLDLCQSLLATCIKNSVASLFKRLAT